MRIGVFEALNGPITHERALAAAVEAEVAGFDSFWLSNIFALDALTAFAGALSDGTFLGWAGPTTIRDHVVPIKVYSDVPSYRAILDRDGKATVAEAGLIGSEDEVLEGLAALAAAGATDFGAGVFAGNAEDRARTMALLGGARS